MAMPPNVIHDPYPLIIVCDIWADRMRGVNLHYLTFPYIKNLLQAHCEDRTMSYSYIKSDKFMRDAFRTYIRRGVSRVKKLDCEILLTVLGTVRSTFGTNEIENMRNYIRESLKAQMNTRIKQFNPENMVMGGQDRGLIGSHARGSSPMESI